MDPKDIKYNIIANEAKFKDFANPNLVSQTLKNYQQTPTFIKGYSKKTKSYKDSIVSERQENYDGKWYESGWVINNQNNILANKITPLTFSYADRYFRPLDEFPYSKSGSTGVYFNEIWSGYSNNDKRLPSGLQTGMYLCGFINEDFSGTYTEVMPYRNIFEFIDHKDIQVGDMGNRWFHSGEERVKGEFISKNNIYFLSGLGPKNLLDNNIQFLVFSDHIRNIRTTSEGRQLPEPIAFYWYPEKQNKTRYSVFIHTGNLNLIKIPIQPQAKPTTKQFGLGNLFQYKNSKWGLDNYAIELTGIYPQTLTKTFSVANTGNNIIDIYFSPEDPTLELSTKALRPRSDFIWTNENIRIYPSGTTILTTSLAARSNLNIDLIIKTTGLASFLNTVVTKNIGFYQITGQQLISGSVYKPLAIQNNLPVKISCLTNNTKVKIDDFFFRSAISGLSFTPTAPSFANTVGKNTFTFTTGGLNFDTRFFGLTYYSTGNNLNQTQVAQDLNRKLKRLDQFSNTGAFSGMRRVYPILSGESYLYVDSNRDWLNINSNENIFRWISGVSGMFSSPTSFNPITGALQVDVQMAIKPDNLLPNKPNESGSNFNVTFTGSKLGIINQAYPNNFISNTANTGFISIPIILEKGKSYRFLQTDNTDVASIDFNILPEDANYFNYRVYEPDYNKVNNKNYKLTTINIPNSYNGSLLLFQAYNGSRYWTGSFPIYSNTGTAVSKKINDFSQTYTSSGEWFVFGFEPNIKELEPKVGFLPFQEVYQSGSAKINPILNNLKLNNYRNGPYLSTTFYSNIENAVEVLNDYESNFSNPCYSISGKIDQQRKWWRLKVKNKDGSTTTGCYSHDEFISLSSKVYSEKNPLINVIPGERYNFVRGTLTNFEITGLQLRFFQQLGNPIINGTGYDSSLITGILTGTQILNNYTRKTHVTDPNLLNNLFGDTKTKYFEYITFTIPTGYSVRNTGIKIISYGVNSTGFFTNLNGSSLLPYENLTGTSLNNSDYLFFTTPVFSGDVTVRSSDTSRGVDKYTFIISGSGSNIDCIGKDTL
jgi:hypothetical protein